jgi:hypothetical protein
MVRIEEVRVDYWEEEGSGRPMLATTGGLAGLWVLSICEHNPSNQTVGRISRYLHLARIRRKDLLQCREKVVRATDVAITRICDGVRSTPTRPIPLAVDASSAHAAATNGRRSHASCAVRQPGGTTSSVQLAAELLSATRQFVTVTYRNVAEKQGTGSG